jgi:hypothetical protein
VDEADPDRLVAVAEPLVQAERVPGIVRPDPDLRVGQAGGHVGRGHALDVDQEGRHPAVHAGPPVHGDRGGQAVKESLAQGALVGHDRVEPADRIEIVDGRVEPSE